MTRELVRAPLFRVVVAWHVVWGILAILTGARFLIELFNSVLLAIAVGVVVAYAKNVITALRTPNPDSASILTVGIWLSWLAIIEYRMLSIIWRALGNDDGLVNTDYLTHALSVSMLAGLCHLAGPEAIEGRVPTRQWVRIGLVVAAGTLFTLAAVAVFGKAM